MLSPSQRGHAVLLGSTRVKVTLVAAVFLHFSASCSGRPGAKVHQLGTGRNGLLVSVFFTDARTGFAVGGDREEGSDAILIRTRDGGATWESCPTGLRTRLYAVHFPTRRTGYAVGLHGALLKTEDGGERWARMDTGLDTWLASVFFTSDSTGLVVGGGESGGVIVRTRDGGRTWRSRVEDVPRRCRSASYRDICFVDRNRGYVVGERGVILRTLDGGDSWESCRSGADVWLRAVHFLDAQNGFVAGSAGVLLATSDGGASWRHLELGSEDKLNDVVFLDKTIGYVATMGGRLRRTADGGATWRTVHETSGALTALSLAKPRVGYAVGDHGTVVEFRER